MYFYIKSDNYFKGKTTLANINFDGVDYENQVIVPCPIFILY